MSRFWSLRSLCTLLLLTLASFSVQAQDFDLSVPASATDPKLPAVMRDLAERMLPVYQEPDADRYMMNLAALQIAVGDYAAAYRTRELLRDRRRELDPDRMLVPGLLYDIYANAKVIQTNQQAAFEPAYKASYRDIVRPLSDQDALVVTRGFEAEAPVAQLQSVLQAHLDRWRSLGRIPLPNAVELIRAYVSFEAQRSFSPLIAALNAEEDLRRYNVSQDVVIKGARGVRIHAVVVRPRLLNQKLPTLLEYTIHSSRDATREFASQGYVGVTAYTRGKNSGRVGRIHPFIHDGDDARAVIAWIAKQPWSDGRVAMVGDEYSGFTAWSVARRMPVALKAIATSAPMAPGIDFPMAGNIPHNEAYRWAYEVARKTEKPAETDAQWRKRDLDWYRSGKSYRQLDRRGTRSDIVFSSWLDHPSYDRFWRKLIPDGKQFAKIDIPILTTAGYYGADAGALHYFGEQLRQNPKANHTLLIGPYDDAAINSGIASPLRGFWPDPVAVIKLRKLRYQWLDHVLKNAARPELLKDRVNYQLAGANEWRHAPSIKAMANGSLRFYLDASGATPHRLTQAQTSGTGFIDQTVKFADRSDASAPRSQDIFSKTLQTHNALSFVSEPLQQPTEFAGLLSGQLDVLINRMDVDLKVSLYELKADGGYVQLFDPYEFRASYLEDRSKRQLLKGGKRQLLSFTVERLSSRKLQAGSRVVLVLGVNKRPDREINYGSGKPVSEETIADARPALKLRWYNSSYIDLPIRK